MESGHAFRRNRVRALLMLAAMSASIGRGQWVLAHGRGTVSSKVGEEETPPDAQDPGDTDSESANGPAPVGGVNRRTGLELELHGESHAIAGHPVVMRGVTYEVIGLSTLRVLSGAKVQIVDTSTEVRSAQPLAEATSDSAGRFVVSFVPPVDASISVIVTQGTSRRTFDGTIQVRRAERVNLLTDRQRYEPGETAHAWLRVVDTLSLAPMADIETTFDADNPQVHVHQVRKTAASGVASVDIPIPASANEGDVELNVDLPGTPGAARASFHIGRRTTERLMLEAHATTPVVSPQGHVRGTIIVRTPSGSPVTNAHVVLREANSGETLQEAQTDARGVVDFDFNAPSYAPHRIDQMSVRVDVDHPAAGSAQSSFTYTVAQVPYTVLVTPGMGAVVPEVDSPLYVQVHDPNMEPPPAGTVVNLTGPGFPAAGLHVTTDTHGIAVANIRLPRGAAALHQGGDCASRIATSFDVTLGTTVPVSSRLCVIVAPHADLAVLVGSSVVAPGATLAVEVRRRPSVQGRSVWVDLFNPSQEGAMIILGSKLLAGTETKTQITLPDHFVGLLSVRARPVSQRMQPEGQGASDAVIVRPASAFVMGMHATADVYHVRDKAEVLLETPAGLSGGHVALVMRDLATMSGEHPFVIPWLQTAFDQGVIHPDATDGERLIRQALAEVLFEDLPLEKSAPLGAPDQEFDEETVSSTRTDLRDPFYLRDELERRALGEVMQQIESTLETAVENNDPSGVALPGWKAFNPGIVHTLIQSETLDSSTTSTLGGDEMTLGMIQAVDPTFTYDRVARRIARKHLVSLMSALSSALEDSSGTASLSTDPPQRWLSRLVEHGSIEASALRDPWGGTFALHKVAPGHESVALGVAAAGWELVSSGPDRVVGSGDDVRRPNERAVPEGSIYAVTSGEDTLLQGLASIATSEDVLRQLVEAYTRQSAAAQEESRGDVTRTTSSTESSPSANEPYGSEYEPEVAANGRRYRRPAQESSILALLDDGEGFDRGGAASSGHAGFGWSHSPTTVTRMAAAQNAAAAQIIGQLESQDVPTATPPTRSAMMTGLAALVREKFPATLHFVADSPLDASGKTRIEFPLADALTRYKVEAIAWTDDGWTTTSSTTIRVDQDAVADAPVPPYVTLGDVLRVPLRLSNRTQQGMQAKFRLTVDGDLGIAAQETAAISVAAGDAAETIVSLTTGRVGKGTVVITAIDPSNGQELDAIRRPIEVLADARPVRMEAVGLMQEKGQLTLDVPSDAVYRADGVVRVALGSALLGASIRGAEEALTAAWLHLMSGQTLSHDEREQMAELLEEAESRMGGTLALALRWDDPDFTDEMIAESIEQVEAIVDGIEEESNSPDGLSNPSGDNAYAMLMFLTYPLTHDQSRTAQATRLHAVARRLSAMAERYAVRRSDTQTFAGAAAILSWSSQQFTPRAREFLRRVVEAYGVAGTDAYSVTQSILTDNTLSASDRVQTAAWFGIALANSGDRTGAFDVVQSIATRRLSENSDDATFRTLLLARLLPAANQKTPDTVKIILDGTSTEVKVNDGIALVSLRELSTPGHHVVRVDAGDQPVFVRAEGRYGRPWNTPLPVAPYVLRLEGEPGARDTRAKLTLRASNRGARLLTAARVEIELPAGAELDESTRVEMAKTLAGPVQLIGRTLHLSLRALAPGGTVTVPLGVRWTIGGSLHGFGATMYASDALGASALVLAPRTVEITDHPAATAP